MFRLLARIRRRITPGHPRHLLTHDTRYPTAICPQDHGNSPFGWDNTPPRP